MTAPRSSLNDKGLGSREQRWLALEKQNANQAIELTPEQAAFLEKLNPCFREMDRGAIHCRERAPRPAPLAGHVPSAIC